MNENHTEIVEAIGEEALLGILAALENATRKHPVFAFRFMDDNLENVQDLLEARRAENDEDGNFPCACDIVREELLEAMEAFGKGQLKQCIFEIDDTIAAMIRMRRFVESVYKSVMTMGV